MVVDKGLVDTCEAKINPEMPLRSFRDHSVVFIPKYTLEKS